MSPRPTSRSARSDRGTTLLEAIIALAVLMIGIAGTMQLQMLGITSNAGARANTRAYQLARELAAALSQVGPANPLLLPVDFRSDAPPPEFGRILVKTETLTSSSFKTWADGMPLAGVTTDAEIFRDSGADPLDKTKPLFQRRWQVWQLPNASTAVATGGGLNVVAVSVTYREASLTGQREVVLLTQVSNTGLSASFISAYR
jgi:type IV pilus assembly protein PilV